MAKLDGKVALITGDLVKVFLPHTQNTAQS